MGDAVQIKGDAERRREVEDSLEVMVKKRMAETEAEARSKAKAIEDHAIRRAEEIIDEAVAKAEALVREGEDRKADTINRAREEGYRDGFEVGYSEAVNQVQSETVRLLEGAQTLLQGAYEARKHVLARFRQDAYALVRHVSRKITGQALGDPDAVLAMLDQAAETLYLSGRIQVVVSPETLSLVRDYADKTASALEAMSRFEFVADPQLDLREIYIISDQGAFNLSPDAQVERLLADTEAELPVEAATDEPPAIELQAPEALFQPTVRLPEPEPPAAPAADDEQAEAGTFPDDWDKPDNKPPGFTPPNAHPPERAPLSAPEVVTLDDLDVESVDFDDDPVMGFQKPDNRPDDDDAREPG